jgi:hypothetical protein
MSRTCSSELGVAVADAAVAAADLIYDPDVAGALIERNVLGLLPE